MSHTQLQGGIAQQTTAALQSINTLNLQKQQLEQRERQNQFTNIMSLARQDPRAATEAFNRSFGQEFGKVEFMGTQGEFSTFSFFDAQSGQKQSAILNRNTGEFQAVGGAQAQKIEAPTQEQLFDNLRTANTISKVQTATGRLLEAGFITQDRRNQIVEERTQEITVGLAPKPKETSESQRIRNDEAIRFLNEGVFPDTTAFGQVIGSTEITDEGGIINAIAKAGGDFSDINVRSAAEGLRGKLLLSSNKEDREAIDADLQGQATAGQDDIDAAFDTNKDKRAQVNSLIDDFQDEDLKVRLRALSPEKFTEVFEKAVAGMRRIKIKESDPNVEEAIRQILEAESGTPTF